MMAILGAEMLINHHAVFSEERGLGSLQCGVTTYRKLIQVMFEKFSFDSPDRRECEWGMALVWIPIFG